MSSRIAQGRRVTREHARMLMHMVFAALYEYTRAGEYWNCGRAFVTLMNILMC